MVVSGLMKMVFLPLSCNGYIIWNCAVSIKCLKNREKTPMIKAIKINELYCHKNLVNL